VRPSSPLWNWLPTFLAVAEHHSVALASRALGLTPQAVSRTLLLLERQLEMPLFERRGRRLTLNSAGARLRDGAREALDRVDSALGELHGNPFTGPLRVVSIGVLTEHFVIPGLIELKRRHAEAFPVHANLMPAEAHARIVRGEVDVAFHYEDLSPEDLTIERVGSMGKSVYCGRGHPLYAKRRVSRADVLEHAFSVPEVGDSGRRMDGWPPSLPRDAGMQITLLRSNLQVSLSGILLTVLPDVTARPHMLTGELRRLREPQLPPIDVYAVRNKLTPARGSALELIALVKQALDDERKESRAALRQVRSLVR
jgi:DNA-binding transcriptional LysR family regulator